MKLLRLVGIFAMLLVPVNANAHAGLVSATPAASSTQSFMPDEIQLTFSEDLLQLEGKNVNSVALSFMKHTDLGLGIELTDISVDGAILSAKIPVGEYETGKYVVAYSVVSADGHKLNDSFSFTLTSFGSPIKTVSPIPTPVQGDGVLPLPIVLALAVLVALGGFFALRARRK